MTFLSMETKETRQVRNHKTKAKDVDEGGNCPNQRSCPSAPPSALNTRVQVSRPCVAVLFKREPSTVSHLLWLGNPPERKKRIFKEGQETEKDRREERNRTRTRTHSSNRGIAETVAQILHLIIGHRTHSTQSL